MVKMMRQFDGVHRVPAQRNHAGGPADGQRRRGAVGGSSPAGGGSPASAGSPISGGSPAVLSSPEGRFLASAGKPLSRLISDLKDRWAAALVRVRGTAAALDHAIAAASERRAHHRGGDRPWLLRLTIPLATGAEALTAFVAMEVLVSTTGLAFGLAAMTALVGAGIACIIANRRLHRLAVPASARAAEIAFVVVLTLLRFVSLDVQSSDALAALGGAALAALISAVALLAIEEVVVETDTFGVFLSRVRVSLRRRQSVRAMSQLAGCQARLDITGQKFEQHFLDFLLKAEGFPLAEAEQRARALRIAICRTDQIGATAGSGS
jgi:hypothetical protein